MNHHHNDIPENLLQMITSLPANLEGVSKEYLELFLQEKSLSFAKEFVDFGINLEQCVAEDINQMSITLPNGKQNSDYEAFVELNHKEVLNYRISGAEELGLSYEPLFSENADITKPQAIRLYGKPCVAGENLELTLEYEIKNFLGRVVVKERKLSLIIAPDPKTLWRNIPTPTNIPYYKADEYCSSHYIPGEKCIVAASKRGRSHAHIGKPRDDHYAFEHLENGWYILAVADGAGSAEYSRQGSKIACNVVLEHCKESLANSDDFDQAIFDHYAPQELAPMPDTPPIDNTNTVEQIPTSTPDTTEPSLAESSKKNLLSIINDNLYRILGHAVWKAHKAIEKEALSVQYNTRDYATTLLLCICKKFGEDGWFVASYWVGDGALGLYTGDDVKLMGRPDGGEYAGQTRFLVMPEVVTPESLIARTKVEFVKDFSALMLMTDGVSDPEFETDSNLESPEKWQALWDKIRSHVQLDNEQASATELLEWLDFWAVGNHDDRTILLLF
ncbi:MAG: protein phosphatase 2C domain-containing protein [Akkermansiaceae bacterium]|nr:protein phosphatase 2C domain-containing protein [Akkermansiaceae bacterium]